ncbi:hypothetical protein [Christiangramia echinicola]|uniref:SLOG domain-containing protein n=1 Tax=Christiangramia echinicola TaxID=279359 RepID=UPI0003F4B5E3|nr:hypothetical protein [Christiangramia echinicola]
MVSKKLKNIFLSASIPLPERDPKYIDSADVIAIRDSVIALATTILPHYRLIWGGHPSITPLINYVLQKMNLTIQDHVLLYQSRFFENFFPEDNNKFENVRLTPANDDREISLGLMRELMIGTNDFYAGVFIGGMEGIEIEYKMFREFHPNAKVIPLGSTGAGSKMVYDNFDFEKNERFLEDYAYMSLFQDLLIKNK